MKFKEFIEARETQKTQEQSIDESKTFSDSSDATEFMYSIEQKMSDAKLMAWATVTDRNFDTNTKSKLQKAIKAYSEFISEIEKAE